MKKIKIVLSLMLIFILIFSAACGKKNEDLSKKPPGGYKPPVFEDTDINLVKSGTTKYRIVVPAQATENETLAANELKLFWERSTGIAIEIVKDSAVKFSVLDYNISIGETKLLSESGQSVPDDLGTSGYFLNVSGNSLFITGNRGYGTLYGVYGFLEYNFGIGFYGYDEYDVPHYDTLKLVKFDKYKEIPSFDYRSFHTGNYAAANDMMTGHRLRIMTLPYLQGFAHHSTFNLVPTSYVTEHPEWFAGHNPNATPTSVTEICFTSEGAVNKAIETLIAERNKYEHDGIEKVMIGPQDNSAWCNCPDCQESDKLYTRTGTYVRFGNKIAAAMKEWEIANNRKQLEYVLFAYRKTEAAPAKYDKDTKKWLPVHESVVPLDNVSIRFAPLGATFNRSFLDENYNQAAKTVIESWSAVTDKFSVWSYPVNYEEILMWYNDFHSTKENFQIFKDMGATELFDEFIYLAATPAFTNVRQYVKAKLMWNLQLDPTELAYDFIKHYYKDAAAPIQEYFDLVNIRFQQIDKELIAKNGGDPTKGLATRVFTIYETNFKTEGYWPFEFLLRCESLLKDALAAASSVQEPVLRDKLEKRVKFEAVTIKYVMLELYSSQFTADEYKDLIDLFEKDCALTGITTYTVAPPTSVVDLIKLYRAKLEKM